jgi:hypothetical protein
MKFVTTLPVLVTWNVFVVDKHAWGPTIQRSVSGTRVVVRLPLGEAQCAATPEAMPLPCRLVDGSRGKYRNASMRGWEESSGGVAPNACCARLAESVAELYAYLIPLRGPSP